MNSNPLKSELMLAGLLFCFGLTLLPLSIYWVGIFVVGPYDDEAGVLGLVGAIWEALGRGRIFAWLLVLSPYFVVQLARLARALWRAQWRL